MGERILDLTMATEIKAAIWSGEPQSAVAARYSVTQATISRISSGAAWYDSLWPDQSIGALSLSRRVEIHRTRYAGVRAAAVVQSLAKISRTTPGDIAAAIAGFVDEAEESDASELVAAMADHGPSPEGVRQSAKVVSEVAFTEQDWLELKQSAVGNPLVDAADSGGVHNRQAVLTVFRNISLDQWNSKMAKRLVAQTLKELTKNG